MAGPAASSEPASRRALRLAIGVTFALILIQLVPWPMSQPMLLFCAFLLQDATPMSLRTGMRTIGFSVACSISGFLIALLLWPYILITIVVFCLLLYRLFIYFLSSGAHILGIVGVVIGAVLMPALMRIAPELATAALVGLIIDFFVAFLIARIGFWLIPPPPQEEAPHALPMTVEEASPIALDLVIVATPLLAYFLMAGDTDILVLIYGILLATGISSAGSAEMGLNYVKANLLFGGVGMLIVYELLVIAPFFPFMVVLLVVACFIFGRQIFSGSHDAGVWASGFNGFLLLLGGALVADGVIASVKIFNRVIQIGWATLYIVFAFAVLALIRDYLSRATRPAAWQFWRNRSPNEE
jgi:hypothetical protein